MRNQKPPPLVSSFQGFIGHLLCARYCATCQQGHTRQNVVPILMEGPLRQD
uniref:Uncharacterized protein n=1 Tax=Sus scrofa TaxID=9823 RepID=A0A4X1SG96_PIG